jgi:hypothetical protein
MPPTRIWSALFALAVLNHPAPRLCAQAVPAAVTLAQGDAFEDKMQTKESLRVYLQLEREGRKDAELLYRIAREYSELIPDATAPAEKQRLGETALDYSKRAVAADGKNASAYLSLAICYGRLAFFQDNKTKLEYSRQVRANAETALQLDPKLDYAYYILGAWNFEIANLNFVLRGLANLIYGGLPDASNAKAVEYLQKAIALAPQRASHHIELGRTYAAMGMNDKARDELEQGLVLPVQVVDDHEMKRIGREILDTLPKRTVVAQARP